MSTKDENQNAVMILLTYNPSLTICPNFRGEEGELEDDARCSCTMPTQPLSACWWLDSIECL